MNIEKQSLVSESLVGCEAIGRASGLGRRHEGVSCDALGWVIYKVSD